MSFLFAVSLTRLVPRSSFKSHWFRRLNYIASRTGKVTVPVANERSCNSISRRSWWYTRSVGRLVGSILAQTNRKSVTERPIHHVHFLEREGHYERPRVLRWHSIQPRDARVCVYFQNRPFSFNKLIDDKSRCACETFHSNVIVTERERDKAKGRKISFRRRLFSVFLSR